MWPHARRVHVHRLSATGSRYKAGSTLWSMQCACIALSLPTCDTGSRTSFRCHTGYNCSHTDHTATLQYETTAYVGSGAKRVPTHLEQSRARDPGLQHAQYLPHLQASLHLVQMRSVNRQSSPPESVGIFNQYTCTSASN